MRIITGHEPGQGRPKAVVTVGMFDGVHVGHRHILRELTDAARGLEALSVVVTFTNHPLEVIRPQVVPGILTTTGERLALIETTGVDCCLLLDFTAEVQRMDASVFLDYLDSFFDVQGVVTGFNNNIGNKSGGPVDEVAAARGMYFKRCSDVKIGDDVVSSTEIRRLLEAGEIAVANAMLGRSYAVAGNVCHGRQIGRTIGFPTANLKPVDSRVMLPADGVYFGAATIEGTDHAPYRAMISVGKNPTVDGQNARTTEIFMLDLPNNYDLYGKSIIVNFMHRRRDMKRFPSLSCLTRQLEDDRMACSEYFQSI